MFGGTEGALGSGAARDRELASSTAAEAEARRGPPTCLGELPPLLPLSDALAAAFVGSGVALVDVGELRAQVVRRALEEGGSPQRLLLPVTATVGRAIAERLLAWADALDAVGLSVAAFGPGQVALKRIPEPLGEVDWAALLPALAQALPAEVADHLPEAAMRCLARAAPGGPITAEALDALCAAVADLPLAPPLATVAGAERLRDLLR